MAKTTRRTSTNKRAAKLPAALKAMENMVIEKADLGVSIKQITQKLAPAGISADVGYIAYAGLSSTFSGQVQINISSGGYASTWPEWAYEVAEGALHFNKKILVIYNNQPFGSNLLEALCLNETA